MQFKNPKVFHWDVFRSNRFCRKTSLILRREELYVEGFSKILIKAIALKTVQEGKEKISIFVNESTRK